MKPVCLPIVSHHYCQGLLAMSDVAANCESTWRRDAVENDLVYIMNLFSPPHVTHVSAVHRRKEQLRICIFGMLLVCNICIRNDRIMVLKRQCKRRLLSLKPGLSGRQAKSISKALLAIVV